MGMLTFCCFFVALFCLSLEAKTKHNEVPKIPDDNDFWGGVSNPEATTEKKHKATKKPPTKTSDVPDPDAKRKKKHKAAKTSSNNSNVRNELLTLIRGQSLNVLKSVLGNLDITFDPNRSIDWFQIALKMIDLYRQNITSILPRCLKQHPLSVTNLTLRLLNEPQKCMFQPIQNLTHDVNGTVVDVYKLYTDFMDFYKNIKDTNIFYLIARLGIAEQKDLVDMNDQVVGVVNATFALILTPWCFMDEVGYTFNDLLGQYNQTWECVRKELDQDDCGDESGENPGTIISGHGSSDGKKRPKDKPNKNSGATQSDNGLSNDEAGQDEQIDNRLGGTDGEKEKPKDKKKKNSGTVRPDHGLSPDEAGLQPPKDKQIDDSDDRLGGDDGGKPVDKKNNNSSTVQPDNGLGKDEAGEEWPIDGQNGENGLREDGSGQERPDDKQTDELSTGSSGHGAGKKQPKDKKKKNASTVQPDKKHKGKAGSKDKQTDHSSTGSSAGKNQPKDKKKKKSGTVQPDRSVAGTERPEDQQIENLGTANGGPGEGPQIEDLS